MPKANSSARKRPPWKILAAASSARKSPASTKPCATASVTGAFTSATFTAEAVDTPEIANVQLMLYPPAYTGLGVDLVAGRQHRRAQGFFASPRCGHHQGCRQGRDRHGRRQEDPAQDRWPEATSESGAVSVPVLPHSWLRTVMALRIRRSAMNCASSPTAFLPSICFGPPKIWKSTATRF